MTYGQMLDLISGGKAEGRRTGWPVKDFIVAVYPKSTEPAGDPHLEWRTTLAVVPYTPSNLDQFATDWKAQTFSIKTPLTIDGDSNG